jgi:hypothetical protein
MNEDELNQIVETRLAAALAARQAAERERVRWEVILELRREADRAHHTRINSRHAIQDPLGGLTPEQERERVRQMDERRRLAGEKMDRANSKRVDGQLARSLRPTRVDAVGGSSGFKIK